MDLIKYYKTVCVPFLRTKIKNERGASLVEYALLVALIAIVAVGVMKVLGGNASTKLSQAGSAVG